MLNTDRLKRTQSVGNGELDQKSMVVYPYLTLRKKVQELITCGHLQSVLGSLNSFDKASAISSLLKLTFFLNFTVKNQRKQEDISSKR